MDPGSGENVESEWRRLLKRKRRDDQPEKAPVMEDDDLYDCSDLCIPSNKTLVQEEIDKACEEWIALDDRKISSTETLPSWYENHVRLPEQFDFASQLNEPPTPDETGDKIVDLNDPSKTLFYDTALWHIFAKLPTSAQLEKKCLDGSQIPNSLAIKDEITQARAQYTRLDGHALNRLRISDRHGLPDPETCDRLVSTLTFECWRCHLAKGSTNDPNRLVVEVLASQTLLDLHRLICELAEDLLWQSTKEEGNENQNQATPQDEDGMFFIENVFYTCGTVDYAKPIQDWLQAPGYRKRLKRLNVLQTTKKEMHDVKLEEVNFSLGMRYMHVCHGDVETSIFLVDRSLSYPGQDFPVIHDIWTNSNTTPDCSCCYRVASRVAYTPDGLVALCRYCTEELGHKSIDYVAWRSSTDISTHASDEKYFYS